MFLRAWIRSVSACLPLGFGLLLACSSGGSGGIGGGALTTSVPGNKTMDSLSSSERTTYCHDVAAYYTQQITATDIAKARCGSKAYSASFTVSGSSGTSGTSGTPTADERRQKCTDAYNQCLAQPPSDTINSASIQTNCEQSKTFTGCKATVSQLNSCLSEEIAQAKQAYSMYDSLCSSIGSDAGFASTVDRSEPASCKSIESLCPGLGSSSTQNDTATSSGSGSSTGGTGG